MIRGIFLDRDGVIFENRPDYIKSWDEAKFIPGVIDAIIKLSHSDYKVFIVTNQSAVGRGIISTETANKINHQLKEIIKQNGGMIEEIFLCPHTPEDNCLCRKPKPGLILMAKEKYNIDLEGSILIGDSITDLQAGFSAGVGKNILVRTGRGASEELKSKSMNIESFRTFDSLPDAVKSLQLLINKVTHLSDNTITPQKE
jgi:D-glycero-D-manno-heptose 1,7-bisphosphate phosphatase